MATSLSRSSLSISNPPFSHGFQFIDRLLFTPSSWCQSSWFSKYLSRSVRAIDAVAVDNLKIKDPIIVIDNYDSTYNLCQYVGELGCAFEVYRSDEISVNELKRKNPIGIVISPGPERGISLQIVLELGPSVPLFGVCMGLQCIGDAFGGKIVPSPSGAVRGKSSLIYYDEKGHDGLLTGLSNPFAAGRYHCFVIEKESFPDDVLEVTAWTEDGLIMAARHKEYKHLQGVQFHPESVLTPQGKMIVRNFIKMVQRGTTNR